MKPLTFEETIECWLNSPSFQNIRDIIDPDDWGDQETVGVNLKVIGTTPFCSKEEDFGIFLGKHDVGFVVGIKTWDCALKSGEAFSSLEELKQRWEID